MDKPSPETVSHVLRSTDLSKFATNFEDTRRQNSLRELTFVVCLPTHGDSRDDHATNEAVFFEALKGLFSLLEKWDQQSPSDGSFKLWLRFEYDIQNSDGPVEYNFNVSKSTAVRRYLDINTTELPVLRRIKSFRISGTFGRVPHPATMCRLAGLFTQLEELNIEYCDPAIKRQEMRKEHRFALAAGLKKLSILSNLSKLKLERNSNCDPANHSFACQDLEDEEHVDVLCESIRQLAEVGRLTELELKNILVSPDLFRDRRSGGTPDNKLCPALRRLKVEDGILSPSGEWWYTGDPEAVEACSSGTDYGSGDDDDSDDNSDTSDDGDDDEKDAIVKYAENSQEFSESLADNDIVDTNQTTNGVHDQILRCSIP